MWNHLRALCEREGLHLVWPLPAATFDAVRPQGLRLADLLPKARGAALVADGGGDFFSRFVAASGAISGGLDAYTQTVFRDRIEPTLLAAGHQTRLIFPFMGAQPAISFAALGQLVGLGPPGPLGIQIHPQWGPWWAYRALVVTDAVVENHDPPVGNGCDGCDAPCVLACHGSVVSRSAFDFHGCLRTRKADPRCRDHCDARLACIRGPEHRYPLAQIHFHHRACATI